MPQPQPAAPMDTDRNLLFGVLALQSAFIDNNQFAEVCAAWTTRKQSPIIFSGPDQPVPVLYGPDPVFVVDPGKVIRGVVRAADTGKPWPGVEVLAHGVSAKTDAAGRYESRPSDEAMDELAARRNLVPLFS